MFAGIHMFHITAFSFRPPAPVADLVSDSG